MDLGEVEHRSGAFCLTTQIFIQSQKIYICVVIIYGGAYECKPAPVQKTLILKLNHLKKIGFADATRNILGTLGQQSSMPRVLLLLCSKFFHMSLWCL